MYGYDIINASFLEEGDNIDNKPEFIYKTYSLNFPSKTIRIRNLLTKTLLERKFPMQVSLFYDKNIVSTLDKIIKDEKPDILMCDMIRTSEYLKKYKIPKILDMDDMLSIRYERQLNSDITNINPYGAFLYTFPQNIQKILSNSFLKKIVLSSETKLIKNYENRISDFYDSVVFVSKKEADTLNKIKKTDKAFAVPLGVDTNYFKRECNVIKEKNSISFLGAMNVAHNETAALYFCENVLPLIKEKIPDIKLYIIGGGVTEKIRKLETKNVIVTGRVDDVRNYLLKTQVFICPLLFGSGIKTKNLEAMALGIPVVTSTIGAESIDAVNGKDWIVCDGIHEIKDAIIKILNTDSLQETLSNNGQNYIINNFTWENVMKNWKKVFDYIS